MSNSSYKFTIEGIARGTPGNPQPKLRKTARQLRTRAPGVARYEAYMAHVRDCLLRSVPADERKALEGYFVQHGRPLTIPPGGCASMRVLLEWKDNVHGDPENCFGAIADALFKDDKWLGGEVHQVIAPTGVGAAHVEITILEESGRLLADSIVREQITEHKKSLITTP